MISKGVQYMLLATFLFAVMNVFVKMLPAIPAVEIVFFRSFISLAISYVLLKRQGVSVWGKRKGWLLLRGIAGAVALVLFFYTLQVMPLATAVTIWFTTPIFASIIGIFLNKEPVSAWQWVFYLMAFGGVVMVEGFDPRVTPTLLVIGIIASVFAGFAYNFIRKINTTEHPLVIIFYFPLVTLPLTGACSAFHWVMPEGWEWGLLILVGLFTQMAQFFMTKSYQLEEVAKVSSLSYMGLLYALIFGWLFFEESFNLQTYLGMGVVLLGVGLSIWYKHTHPVKK
jgi:drug/metabolite transporter (DMT)-like permease